MVVEKKISRRVNLGDIWKGGCGLLKGTCAAWRAFFTKVCSFLLYRRFGGRDWKISIPLFKLIFIF